MLRIRASTNSVLITRTRTYFRVIAQRDIFATWEMRPIAREPFPPAKLWGWLGLGAGLTGPFSGTSRISALLCLDCKSSFVYVSRRVDWHA